ncbi:MAG: cyclic-di-AMP receptor [Anaerolineales bacterium]|nr:cyclic-di-AMP receptor [Anaerolineales bacterium]
MPEQKTNQVAGGTEQGSGAPAINRLMTAVIQMQDERKAISGLKKIGLNAVRFSSTGAFLGRRNATLLVGLAEKDEQPALEVIRKSCHERIEYVSTPLENAPLPMPISTPVTVGGATVFMLTLDRYEEI